MPDPFRQFTLDRGLPEFYFILIHIMPLSSRLLFLRDLSGNIHNPAISI